MAGAQSGAYALSVKAWALVSGWYWVDCNFDSTVLRNNKEGLGRREATESHGV